MDKFHIELYPKADLENEWAKNKHTPGPCMRCGGPMWESLAENALSRALNVYVCPACGMDEALRDAAGKVLPISEWYAVKQHRFAEHKNPQAVKLTPACAFMEIFSGARKTLPLSGARYPISLVAYRGKYYTLTDQRIPYRRDKTEDERFFILTLFAIAHEIEAMGQYSGSLMRVQLAVGLPPAHFGVQAKRFINYFNGRGAVAFQFKGKPYAIFIENTACFPQSFSAAAATVKNLASFPRALVVDIGGFTADYVRLRNGVPDMAACDSLENGVILLYNRICAKANAELDILLEESEIDRILRGEDQDAAPDVIALAEREAQEFINDLLSGLRERMLELKSGKVIFLGGGATLLRRQIEASGKIGQAIFVEDIDANAKGYEYLYRLQHSGR